MKKQLRKLNKKGIDIKSGLYYCNGNEELYSEILKVIIEESVEKKALLNKSAASLDYKGFYREAHALKNVSATIGADSLTHFLTELCAYIKKTNVFPPPENVREFFTRYDDLLKIIEDVI
jgi:HPt (histidine-containing phosphotransfer) domain-containing protein